MTYRLLNVLPPFYAEIGPQCNVGKDNGTDAIKNYDIFKKIEK
jgi:hypothetical protein